MNETDFIRRQLAAERAHLREILEAIRHGHAAGGTAGPIPLYLEWAGSRFMQQLRAHRAALAALNDAAAHPALGLVTAALDGATADTAALPPARRADQLLRLLDAWSEPLETLAGRSLRIQHWRTAARLDADSILEERQLHAAARHAAGLS